MIPTDDDQTLLEYSHDASIFEVRPRVVIFPKNSADIKNVVHFVSENKKQNPKLSITARSAGTDMSGGVLNESIILSFTKHMNKFLGLNNKVAKAEAGMFYRDFEKETLKENLIFASYPSSRETCAIGGIVSNNAGGEKSFEYGKTEKYVKSISMILADGNECEFKCLNERDLAQKLQLRSFEGEIYRKIYALVTKNYDLLLSAKPKVTKNSAGYYLWNVYNKEEKTFDLSKLIVG
jgi:FAD/FMN-containing dehydrogenase